MILKAIEASEAEGEDEVAPAATEEEDEGFGEDRVAAFTLAFPSTPC
jgi:hypothetical protein